MATETPREDIGYNTKGTTPLSKNIPKEYALNKDTTLKKGLVRIRLVNGDVYRYNKETADWLVRHKKAEYVR